MGANAQDVQNSGKIDSLTQAVSELSSKVQKMEADNHADAVWNKRKKFFSIGYMNQTLTHKDIAGLKWKSSFGISMATGRTYYLHKKPLFNMLKFGLDATWFDISYAKYSQPEGWEEPNIPEYSDEDDDDMDLGMHQVEMGMHVGPSITINPVDFLKVSGYFHFVPSASIVILNDEANVSYVSNFAVGGSISYKAISIGIEHRWGAAKYSSFSVDDDEYDTDMDDGYDIDDVLIKDKNRMKTKSLRFFLTLRF